MSFELGAFLLAVGFISLSGVLMPGPVLVAAIAKGYENKHAGAWIAFGHLLVEVPLILLIAVGFKEYLDNIWVKGIVGILGGLILAYMGVKMFMMRSDREVVERAFPGHPIIAGIITTVGNPYFILWWATIGAMLIIEAQVFGALGLLGFIIVHESCDLGWDYFVSYSTYKSKDIWSEKYHKYIFGFCGILLITFGIYFILAFWLG